MSLTRVAGVARLHRMKRLREVRDTRINNMCIKHLSLSEKGLIELFFGKL